MQIICIIQMLRLNLNRKGNIVMAIGLILIGFVAILETFAYVTSITKELLPCLIDCGKRA